MCNFVVRRAPQKNVHEDLKLKIQDCMKFYAKIWFLGVLLISALEQSWVRWQPSNENCSTDVPSCLN
jgi:hypothetical protein